MRRGHALHLTEERHQVVRRDAGGRVVAGPIGVGHRHGVAGEVVDRALHHGQLGRPASGHGEPHPLLQARRARAGIGQGHERVQRGAAGVRGEHVERQRPGEVHHHRAGNGLDSGRGGGDRQVGGGQDEHVDVAGCARQVVAAVQRGQHLPPHRAERAGHRSPGTARTDHPQARRRDGGG